MKVIEKEYFTVLEADEECILVDNRTNEGAFVIYLGKNDSQDNYHEILEDDYVEPSEEEEIFEDLCLRILEEEVNK